MIYRKLDAKGDYTIGRQAGNFFANSAATVAQAVQSRLALFLGEWFLDTSVGTPYNSQILGAGKIAYYDMAIQEIILGTHGVTQITSYASSVNPVTRAATVNATISTIYGAIALTTGI